jgi:hypothetical protein
VRERADKRPARDPCRAPRWLALDDPSGSEWAAVDMGLARCQPASRDPRPPSSGGARAGRSPPPAALSPHPTPALAPGRCPAGRSGRRPPGSASPGCLPDPPRAPRLGKGKDRPPGCGLAGDWGRRPPLTTAHG